MYHLTVYNLDGTILGNEPLSATTDEEAKAAGHTWLEERSYLDKPHRIFHSTGRLVAFKPHQFNVKTGKATL